jgi:hypothetical protein
MIFNKKERLLIQSCPPAGGGVHNWTFDILKVLARHYACDSKLFQAARSIFDRYATRPVDDGEIQRQMGNARRVQSWGRISSPTCGQTARIPRWPSANIVLIEQVVRAGLSLSQLAANSPVPVTRFDTDNGELLNALFPGNPLLCCSKFFDSHETRTLSSWGSLSAFQFIVPSPMSRVWGKTKNDKPSQRCHDNTGPRRFLVIEFDFKIISENDVCHTNGTTKVASSFEMSRMVARLNEDGFTVHDMCAALIGHIAGYIPPVMVVNSGGKSLHAWFYCADVEESTVRHFMRFAVYLGADSHTWSRCQFVRMPGGIRDNGTHQTIVYFNPEKLP